MRADSVLFHPEPTSTICIDSEFPIESYVRMTDATLSDADRKTAEQQFLQEIKISTKTFWIAIDKSHMLGKYRKAQSMKILESMQAEYFPVEIEALKKFINNDLYNTGKTKIYATLMCSIATQIYPIATKLLLIATQGRNHDCYEIWSNWVAIG